MPKPGGFLLHKDTHHTLPEMYDILLARYGPQHWWPAKTRTEMMIGALLTQNTAWINVEKAISALRKNNALSFRNIMEVPSGNLSEWIRPSGYYNQKTLALKALASKIMEYNGSLDCLFKLDTPLLRKELLSVRGIGPETADCILLYAAKRPVFVVDTYTRRLLNAFGYTETSKKSYNEIADLFTASLPENCMLFSEYHALIVRWGKDT